MMTWMLRSWPAMLVATAIACRALYQSADQGWFSRAYMCVSFAGLLMNVAVVALNGGMPARLHADEEIPDEVRPNYKPMDARTRCPFLGDWIPLGGWRISPGDVLLGLAVVAAVGEMFVA